MVWQGSAGDRRPYADQVRLWEVRCRQMPSQPKVPTMPVSRERPTTLLVSSLVEETGIGHNDSGILLDAAFGK